MKIVDEIAKSLGRGGDDMYWGLIDRREQQQNQSINTMPRIKSSFDVNNSINNFLPRQSTLLSSSKIANSGEGDCAAASGKSSRKIQLG